MALVVPTFTYEPVINHSGTFRPIGLALHSCEGDGSQYGWFNDPAAQASSNLWAGKAGGRQQYVSADMAAWAQSAGNYTYLSLEVEGFGTPHWVNGVLEPPEPLTDAQLDTVAYALRWGHDTFGWPLRVTDTPGEGGLICHGYPTSDGGFAGRPDWGGHPCPGRTRSDQRAEIVKRAGGAGVALSGNTPASTDAVKAMQAQLNQVGVPGFTPLAVDGDYGPATTSAVSGFQRGMRLPVDGVAGPQTLAVLRALIASRDPWHLWDTMPTLKQGDQGPSVKRLQNGLNRTGTPKPLLIADGDFGPATFAAVEKLQTNLHVHIDGIAGAQTLALIRHVLTVYGADPRSL